MSASYMMFVYDVFIVTISLQVVADEAIPRLVHGIKGTMNDPEDPEAQMVLIAAAQDMLHVSVIRLSSCPFNLSCHDN